jgi:tripartite-type tricarboxylate transporter receptor subunit TctC
LKGLAISSRERFLFAPEVPTIAELGYPEFDFVIYFPLAVPAATPSDIASLLEHEVQRALKSPDLQQRLLPLDIKIVPSTSAEATARVESDASLWAKLVKATGMHVD